MRGLRFYFILFILFYYIIFTYLYTAPLAVKRCVTKCDRGQRGHNWSEIAWRRPTLWTTSRSLSVVTKIVRFNVNCMLFLKTATGSAALCLNWRIKFGVLHAMKTCKYIKMHRPTTQCILYRHSITHLTISTTHFAWVKTILGHHTACRLHAQLCSLYAMK